MESLNQRPYAFFSLEQIGRPLERNGAIGLVEVAIAKQEPNPEQKIQQIETHQQQCRLLPQVYRLVAHLALVQSIAVIEHKGEQRDGVVGARRKTAGMDQQRHHRSFVVGIGQRAVAYSEFQHLPAVHLIALLVLG